MGRFITIDPDTWWPTFHLHPFRHVTRHRKETCPASTKSETPIEREPYAPFSGGNKPCRECGSWDVGWTYRAHAIMFDDNHLGVFSNEWMLRTCRKCGYTWPEECPTYPLPD